MGNKNLTNQFFDINKLPAEEGILVFPISMSRISNSQSTKKCWAYMKIFSPEKIIKPQVDKIKRSRKIQWALEGRDQNYATEVE